MTDTSETSEKFIGTFGEGQPNAGKYVEVYAESLTDAGKKMSARFDKWSMVYGHGFPPGGPRILTPEECAGVEQFGLQKLDTIR